MAPPRKLTELQCRVLREFDLVARLPLPRVAELCCPFLANTFSKDSKGPKVSILNKRLQGLFGEDEVDRKIEPPGCYVVHRIPVKRGHGSDDNHVLIVMERHTGMVAITAKARISKTDMISFLGSVLDRFQLPCKRLVLLSYHDRASEQIATASSLPVRDLADELGDWLSTSMRQSGVVLEPEVIPHLKDRGKIRLTEENPRKLNKLLQALADRYNQLDRERFPRTKDQVAPIDRLFFAVKEVTSNSNAKRRLPRFDDVCDKATFRKRVAEEKDIHKIYGGRPVTFGKKPLEKRTNNTKLLKKR